MKIIWTATARKHLHGIFDYIAKDKPSAAASTASRIEESVSHLKSFPFLGRRDASLRSRMLSIPDIPYIVFYTVIEGEIKITAVHHAKQGLPTRRM